ncbi:hypothetical protein SUGI_0893040 [Cryptomeria japonica]|nr:hypothetical protein SUGI_0893040 [Cryptomeria japonica]
MDGELDLVGGKGSSPTIFTCRFCDRKFSKSQALGDHMNGHRQDRDNENLEKAKELLEQKGGNSSWMMNPYMTYSVEAEWNALIAGEHKSKRL